MSKRPTPGEIRAAFAQAVNMSADELEEWLATEQSRKVGWKPDGGESIGHASGRRIAALMRTPEDALDESDHAHMRKTIGFIRRHRAREPENMVTSRWRYSLMNWGHDPLK
jgi:predicted NAD/FAD-dependent oxidoreductase